MCRRRRPRCQRGQSQRAAPPQQPEEEGVWRQRLKDGWLWLAGLVEPPSAAAPDNRRWRLPPAAAASASPRLPAGAGSRSLPNAAPDVPGPPGAPLAPRMPPATRFFAPDGGRGRAQHRPASLPGPSAAGARAPPNIYFCFIPSLSIAAPPAKGCPWAQAPAVSGATDSGAAVAGQVDLRLAVPDGLSLCLGAPW